MIPIFNKGNYLKRSLTSIQKQTLCNIEIIAVDDCSTDNSSIYLLRQMQKDPRIKVVLHTYNQGTSLSRIHGVLASSGQYIMSVDPDDLLHLSGAERTYAAAIETKADILEYRIEGRYKVVHHIENWTPCYRNYTGNDELLDNLLTFNFTLASWNTCKKLIRSKIYKRAARFLYPYVNSKKMCNAEDLLQCGTIFLFMKKFVCTQILTYIYYMALDDSSAFQAYQPGQQNIYQKNYSTSLLHYFYDHRKDPYSCSLQDYLRNKSHAFFYSQIPNVIKKPQKKCYTSLWHLKYYDKKEYCLIVHK